MGIYRKLLLNLFKIVQLQADKFPYTYWAPNHISNFWLKSVHESEWCECVHVWILYHYFYVFASIVIVVLPITHTVSYLCNKHFSILFKLYKVVVYDDFGLSWSHFLLCTYHQQQQSILHGRLLTPLLISIHMALSPLMLQTERICNKSLLYAGAHITFSYSSI